VKGLIIMSNSTVKIAGVVKDSIVDGPGLRYAVFVQGCYHKCEGCHNPTTHDPNGGFFVYTDKIISEYLENPMYSGITFSGGEPFLQADALADIALAVKQEGKNIICYTGYTFEYLLNAIQKEGVKSYMRLLYNIDYLIDGPFIKDKASLDCKWRGSTNQRIIDVKASIATGNVVEVELD
jgi:anaerobic ribonucleoside-triphosphate reductase activating protein